MFYVFLQVVVSRLHVSIFRAVIFGPCVIRKMCKLFCPDHVQTGYHSLMNFLSWVFSSLATSLKLTLASRTWVNRGCFLCPLELICGVVWAVTYLRELGVRTGMGGASRRAESIIRRWLSVFLRSEALDPEGYDELLVNTLRTGIFSSIFITNY
jgi:hypothetical protein